MDKARKLLSEQGRFVIVGIMNTLIGTAVMFMCYDLFHLGYWLSSAMNYIVGSIFSYFANKYFTFQSKKKSGAEVVRFVINILICYLISYSVAKPLVSAGLKEIGLPVSVLEQISMLFGMCIFVVPNYLGQKFFVFREKRKD